MHLHQTAATENVAALSPSVMHVHARAQTQRGCRQHGVGLGLNIFFFSFFCSSLHAGMKQAHWTQCCEKASVHNNTAECPSHQRKRRHYHPFIFTRCVFEKKKKERKKRHTSTWRAQANEQWACLLKRQYTPGGIPSTSYHSHLKLNLI